MEIILHKPFLNADSFSFSAWPILRRYGRLRHRSETWRAAALRKLFGSDGASCSVHAVRAKGLRCTQTDHTRVTNNWDTWRNNCKKSVFSKRIICPFKRSTSLSFYEILVHVYFDKTFHVIYSHKKHTAVHQRMVLLPTSKSSTNSHIDCEPSEALHPTATYNSV